MLIIRGAVLSRRPACGNPVELWLVARGSWLVVRSSQPVGCIVGAVLSRRPAFGNPAESQFVARGPLRDMYDFSSKLTVGGRFVHPQERAPHVVAPTKYEQR